MAFGIQSDASLIKPLEGAIVRRFTAGASVTAGQVVAMQSDGKVDPADATSATPAVVGVAVTGASDGDRLDVVAFGPISSAVEGTVGAAIYSSTTAGGMATSAGSNGKIVGLMESAEILFVRPQL